MPEPDAWEIAPQDGRINEGDVHVWLAMVDALLPLTPAVEAVLSPDERVRAERFVFAADRNRFVAARAVLRRLLAGYLGTTPPDVRLSYDAYGKPVVSGYPSAPAFNVSHSHDAAVFAISRAGDVGVDVEALRPLPDAEALAARFFAAREVENLRALAPAERESAFFRGWTRKEAFIKAVGRGLRLPLNSFEVTLGPLDPVEVVRADVAGGDGPPWTLAELPRVPGYVGAVAVRGRPRAIHFRAWRA